MNDYPLSIGEAARRLGLSVDRVRRLSDIGELDSARTPGGHRRFSEAAIAAYEQRQQELHRLEAAPPRESQRPQRSRPAPILDEEPPESPRELEFLEDEEEWRDPGEVVQRARVVETEERERELERKAEEEARRLLDLKHHALRCIAYGIPASVRAKVVEELERNVSSERVPPWLTHSEQVGVVSGLVDEALKPYQEEAAQKRDAELRIKALIDHGTRIAKDETRDWDFRLKYPARREVEDELRTEVEADWTEEEVEDLVDEILVEWEEDQND